MPRFLPFRAVRFAPGTDLDSVIAPPYDVLSPGDVTELAGRSEHNIVHVDVPRGEGDRYGAARDQWNSWEEAGVTVREEEPSFTIYRMRFVDSHGVERDVAGVLGGLEVVDEGAGGVLPHERTTPKAKTDRLDLTRATATNMSPVWGLSLAHGLTDLLREPGEEVGRLEVEGVTHIVERVTDAERLRAITDLLASDDVLIADGHHRYAISRTYRDEVREATGRADSAAEETLAFVNELVDHQLSIEAIHRIYPGADPQRLREELAASFDLTPAPRPTPETLREMVASDRMMLVTASGAEWLAPKDGAFDGVRALDGAYLEHALAELDPDVDYQHGLDHVLERVDSGEIAAAVLIRPTSLVEIQRTAREGLLMPPKSTFFTPKLRTGFVVRPTEPLPH
ncbi:DUF1015 family protein [Nigerium massiliense]|uniref:DUF1015 family protein n=1 Tax=Nigerium massiliense TaxID=1522317 RepID=UPI000590DAC0|nr:DUF1015 domain-containing protein [Nigerium massiliense]